MITEHRYIDQATVTDESTVLLRIFVATFMGQNGSHANRNPLACHSGPGRYVRTC